jgi:uncharacterized protein YecA (UPF0149 family)
MPVTELEKTEIRRRVERFFREPKGSRKNNLADFALRFGLDSVDPNEQNQRNSWLF